MAPSYDATRPVGEWNEGRIVGKGSIIQHWLNGQKVIDFDYNDPNWAAEVEMLKQRGGDVTARGANLSLQDHGDPVWYRNIRLREIPADEAIEHSDVEPETIPDATLQAEREKLNKILENRRKQDQKQ